LSHLGAMLSHLGVRLDNLGAMLGQLGGHLGPMLGRLGAILGPSWAPQPPTHPRVDYGVSGPSAAMDSILAMLQNLGFYVVLGSRRGPGAEELAS